MVKDKIEICTVGGYSEVGRNMTAIKIGDTSVVCDMGLNVQKIVEYEEMGQKREHLTREGMIKIGAIPNDDKIKSWKKTTKGIFASHCHLDHISGIPYLAKEYNCPIYGTPFTNEVIKSTLKNDRKEIPNQIKNLRVNGSINLSKDIKVELIDITHSTPQTSLIAIHSKQGTVLYATDFKLDNHPVIGHKPNYKKIEELAEKPVKALILDSLYSNADKKTPSEKIAREMLKDVLFGTDNHNSAIITTCFASHISRIKSIVDLGRKLNRRVVLMGRSFMKYTLAAEKAGITRFGNQVEIAGYRRQVEKKMKEILLRGPEKYILVCSGGQGEKNAILTRMLKKEFPLTLQPNDHLIFSNQIIPVEPNITNRQEMETRLEKMGIRIFKDIHVSGHGSREDLRDLINMVNPENIIPCHGPPKLMKGTNNLGEEMGYKTNKTLHPSHNGGKLIIK